MRISQNYKESVRFLERWREGGPWVLTAIHEDKRIHTNTFCPEEEKVLSEWLEAHGRDKFNIYFTVNPTLQALTKKASKRDIKALSWLHVDIDPQEGQDLSAEQERALALLKEPPGDLPMPTAIVFSGGGYQGFWKLSEPLAINGHEALANDAARYNRQLETLFEADHCHNVDRIMRLPGTINWPDARKRAKGREPALSVLVEFDVKRKYPLARFNPALQVQGERGFTGAQIQVSGNVTRTMDPKDLPIPSWCRAVIVHGADPDEPERHPSRSEWLFAACCEMVRSGLDNDTIYGVITDPEWGISESVLDKGGRVHKYALHQIKQAREHDDKPELMKMNAEHAVISSIGGKCRILSEEWDHEMGRPHMSLQTKADFLLRYQHLTVNVGTDADGKNIAIPRGEWWVNHPDRQQFNTIIFAPGKEVPDVYNLWKGFAFEAKPGDCGLFLTHIRENLCGSNEEYSNWLLDWMATAVQRPGTPAYTCVVLRGMEGAGKSFFATIFGKLWGRHFMQITDPKHLVGSFNAHLRDCVVLFADEAFYAGDRKHSAMLKTLITEETRAFERKGIDVEIGRNYVHLIMSSNEDWVVPVGLQDRRFFVLDVGEVCANNQGYFRAIVKQLENGGYEALLHELSMRDISNYDSRKTPKTDALRTQKLLSMGNESDWWHRKLCDGRLTNGGEWGDAFSDDLLYDFVQYTRHFSNGRRANQTRMKLFLERSCPKGYPKLLQKTDMAEVTLLDGTRRMIERPRFYRFPSLEECRAHWNESFQGSYEWPKIEIEASDDSEQVV